MKRLLAVVAGGLVVLLVAAELLAVPLATRVIGSALASCTPYETLTVERAARPIVPRLLLGRVRDVELTATGARIGPLRIDDARLTIGHAVLPWALGTPDADTAVVTFRVTETDLSRAVQAVVPLIDVAVELEPEVATVRAVRLPLSVRLELDVDDGRLRIRPVAGDAGWWDRLGVTRHLEPPPQLRVTAAGIDADAVTGTMAVDELPALGGGGGCPRPLGTGGT